MNSCRHLPCLLACSIAITLTMAFHFLGAPLKTSCLTRTTAAAGPRASAETAGKHPPAIRSVHLSKFSYLNWPESCGEMQLRPLLLGAVISAPSNSTRRNLLRQLYMSQTSYAGFQLRWIFILGSVSSRTLQQQIDVESNRYGDIVQLSFRDSYENLTLKTLSAIDWTAAACPEAKFFFKTDTDCMVNPFRIVDYLASLTLDSSRMLYAGSVPRWLEPKRHTGLKKWRVSYQNYPLVKFPRYANGPGYILSGAALPALLEASDRTYPMRLEDVYIGLCAMQAGLAPRTQPRPFLVYQYSYSNWCDYHLGLVMHGVNGWEMKHVWRQILAHKNAARSEAECRSVS